MSDQRATVLRAAGALALAAIVGGAVGALLATRLSPGDERACRSAALAESVLPSVVTIFTSTQGGSGNGTGEIIRDGGYILTNFHVVEPVASGGGLYVEYSGPGRPRRSSAPHRRRTSPSCGPKTTPRRARPSASARRSRCSSGSRSSPSVRRSVCRAP